MSEHTETKGPVGILLSDDLMFTSRVTGTGRDLGLTVRPVRSVAALEILARQQRPACVMVDLANPGLCIGKFVSWLRQNWSPVPRVVAYGSHVDTATLRAAREAGCDLVLPRSKFVEELPRALPEWFGSEPKGG